MTRLLLLVWALLGASVAANAQSLPMVIPGDPISQFLSNAPGIGITGTTNGIQVAAANAATFISTNGTRTSIPTSVVANITKAGAAAALAKALPWVGFAVTAYDVYNALKGVPNTPYGNCPAGTSGPICRWDPNTPPNEIDRNSTQTGFYANTNSTGPCYGLANAPNCTALQAANTELSNPTQNRTIVRIYLDPTYYNSSNAWRVDIDFTNPGSTTILTTSMNSTGGATTMPNPLLPTNNTQIAADIQNFWSGGTVFLQSFKDLISDYAKNPSGLTSSDILPTSTPLTWTMPAVTTSASPVSTSSVPQSDGTMRTVTKTEQATITPTARGTTALTPIPDYPYTRTVTTVTSDPAGVAATTTQTDTTNNGAGNSTVNIPTDYNRETTQQQVASTATQIHNDLDSTGAPTLPDQGVLGTAAVTKSGTDLQSSRDAATNGVDASKSSWFSWVWTPPVGTCSPFAGNVHGYAISWDICSTIYNIRDVIGWLLALFGALQIYGQLFNRE